MIQPLALGDPAGPPDLGVLDAPRGFAWWYLDLLADDGRLLVVIASFGLPFVPGSAPGPARDKPSLNVVLYERGAPRFHLLQEYAAGEGEADADGIRIGDSVLRSYLADGERRLEVAVDAPLPSGERLLLRAELRGPVPRLPPDEGVEPAGAHRWTPLIAGTRGTATLAIGDRTIAEMEGRGYHDRNVAREPLETLGCSAWWWARAPVAGGERVAYVLWRPDGPPQAIALAIRHDGATRVDAVEVHVAERRRGWWGMPWWRAITLRGPGWTWSFLNARVVEDGPFYLRFGVRFAENGDVPRPDDAGAWGVGEWVVPDRLAARWHRPLVGMAVHRPSGPNSPFVGLFTGEWPGRARLMRWRR